MDVDRRSLPPEWSYLRARRLLPVMLALAAAGPAAWWSADTRLDLPQLGTDITLPVTLLILLPSPVAALVIASLHSAMADFEIRAARRLAAGEVAQLTALATLGGGGLLGGLLLAGVPGVEMGVVARSFLVWLGVAGVSAWLFSRALSWVLPLPLCLLLSISVYDAEGAVRPWAIPMDRESPGPAWTLSFTVMLIGVALAVRSSGHPLGRIAVAIRRYRYPPDRAATPSSPGAGPRSDDPEASQLTDV